MSHALESALDDARSAELRRAARALLRRPLLRAGGAEAEEFRLVRRHAGELRSWFNANTGWRLIVDSEVARLVKLAPTIDDPTHPARDQRSHAPFSRRRYVLMCLALSVLERSDAQITLGRLAEGVILAAADEHLARAGVAFQLGGREERADLVAVVRLLLELGVLARVAGDEEAFVRDAGDALYDVQRRVLAVVLAAPRGPSTIAAEDFAERLSQLAADPLPEAEDLRNRALRHHLTRRLLDDPVLYNDELDPAQSGYLTGQRAALTRRISELTGLVAEVRAEGIAMVDPNDDLTDVRMPDAGTDGHVTLLLAEHLAQRAGEIAGVPVARKSIGGGLDCADADGCGGVEDPNGSPPVSEADLHRLVRRLAEEHRAYWRRSSREPGAEVVLVDTALERLVALRLIRRGPDGVRPLPALARYALAAPTIAGERSQLELDA
ncbi:MAG: TIGR02678 family protein [Solirubrobacterales bacterium]